MKAGRYGEFDFIERIALDVGDLPLVDEHPCLFVEEAKPAHVTMAAGQSRQFRILDKSDDWRLPPTIVEGALDRRPQEHIDRLLPGDGHPRGARRQEAALFVEQSYADFDGLRGRPMSREPQRR